MFNKGFYSKSYRPHCSECLNFVGSAITYVYIVIQIIRKWFVWRNGANFPQPHQLLSFYPQHWGEECAVDLNLFSKIFSAPPSVYRPRYRRGRLTTRTPSGRKGKAYIQYFRQAYLNISILTSGTIKEEILTFRFSILFFFV